MTKGLTIFAAAMGALCSVWGSAAQAQDKCEAKLGHPPLAQRRDDRRDQSHGRANPVHR